LRDGDVSVVELDRHRDEKLKMKMKMKDEWCTRVWMRFEDQVECEHEPCDFVNYRFIYVGSLEREREGFACGVGSWWLCSDADSV